MEAVDDALPVQEGSPGEGGAPPKTLHPELVLGAYAPQVGDQRLERGVPLLPVAEPGLVEQVEDNVGVVAVVVGQVTPEGVRRPCGQVLVAGEPPC